MGTHILEIVVMLLIAAILGFLIAWFWPKSKSKNLSIRNKELEKELSKQKEIANQKNIQLEECVKNVKVLENRFSESEAEIALKRIKEKAKDINFERIGIASEKEKEDLKIIGGIGPFIEKKLNALGIFTYKQIANFTDEDREKVNEAIEFFPGRIMRDDWIGQAKKLVNDKKS